MMRNIKKFNSFINEASLRGNTGFPGEDPSKSEDSLINAILAANAEEAERLILNNQSDITNLQGNVNRAQAIQSGHEEELSNLAEDIIREVYGSFIDDVILDLKIVNRPVEDLNRKMKECKNCSLPDLEELQDQEIIDEINRRKIIRTVQQGKGLNVKEIINLPSVAKRLKEILGESQGEQYRILANKIAAGAHFYDLTLSPGQKKSMFRQAPPGACDIEIKKPKKKDEEEEVNPEDILKDIQKNGEINDEITLEGTESTVIARAMDFGLLIHESVKGIYKLITQSLLMQVSDNLGLDAAEIVKANTETKFDEIEEQMIGKNLQRILGLVINSNSKVEEILFNINSSDDDFEVSATESAAFMEQLHWLVYGKLSQVQPAKKCLEIFNSILGQVIDPVTKSLKTLDEISNIKDRSMIDPIINECLEDMEAERNYQAHIAKYGKDSGKQSNQNPPEDKGKFGGFDFGEFGLN
jgi:hypothetical protein